MKFSSIKRSLSELKSKKRKNFRIFDLIAQCVTLKENFFYLHSLEYYTIYITCKYYYEKTKVKIAKIF